MNSKCNIRVTRKQIQKLVNQVIQTYVRLCVIGFHVKNFKNEKNTHEGVLLVVNFQVSACIFAKSIIPPCVFLRFLNCANSIKSIKASHIS